MSPQPEWAPWEDLDHLWSPAPVYARPQGLGALGKGSYFTEPYTIFSPQRVHIGRGVLFNERAVLSARGRDDGGGTLRIGDDCKIGSDFYVHCAHDVEIGARVGISARVAIGDAVGNMSPEPPTAEVEAADRAAVRIRDGVIVGIGAIVLPGVTIGERAAVGAGAVVTRDVAPRAVVFGNPARTVGFWDEETGDFVSGRQARR
jgi:acetyltransferase-like isoleucine patch superfamily enzyme